MNNIRFFYLVAVLSASVPVVAQNIAVFRNLDNAVWKNERYGAAERQVQEAFLQVSTGTVRRYTNFPSRFVEARNIDVWLPEGYSSRKKYAVLYMHDGQMLFDSAGTWNRKEWQVDETLGRLLKERKVHNCIVVGIWNSGPGRHADYFPQKPFENLSATQQAALYETVRSSGYSVFNGQKVHSDDYLRFLVQELKPFIDREFSTRKGRRHTFIAGSSMGGLISLYAMCEYPDVFGGAACLSTHWPGIFSMENNPIPAALIEYLRQHLPDPKNHRFYFDYGTETLDALYAPLQQEADKVLQAAGYSARNWQTLAFPGDDHSERAWAARLDRPLLFLLGR